MDEGMNMQIEIVTKVPAWAVESPILSVNKRVSNGPTNAPTEFINRDKTIK
jgi:hypothetical protein